ncbi:MAG: ribosome biogenesis GTPase Der [Alphaproteobacteria bacterium]|nr:ribosome biogenesis GTPase Der [Alphaproteobacteria bacterium]MBN2675299.1 ribosome biogenesis GTPase Der [Alphaproteobacteria bacterium]
MIKIAIAGRPNTGKSTLFNGLTGTRDALVHDRPGVTRDVVQGNIPRTTWKIFDTAGLEKTKIGIGADSTNMAMSAIEKADAILFVVDGRAGLMSEDIDWARQIKRKNKAKVLLLVNKSESEKRLTGIHDFYKLGFGEPVLIAAEHKKGFDKIYEFLESIGGKSEEVEIKTDNELKIAILGQPNVGKSTFVNKVLGENRQIVKDEPGVTRDTVKISTNFYGRDIVLMDTAGLRRKAGVTDDVETLSALKSLSAIENSNVVILIIDATRDIENQALGIASRVYDAGKILCVALNKWDLVDENEREAKLLKLKHQFNNSFHQIMKPLILAISAEKGTGVKNVFKRVYELWDISNSRAPTSLINKILENLIEKRQPPMSRLKRPMKIKFASQVGIHPNRIVINTGGASDIPESYTRYLRRGLARELNWEQIPIILEYKKSENPFD